MKEIPKIHEGVSALFYGKTNRYPQRSLQSSASRNLDGSEQRVIQC